RRQHQRIQVLFEVDYRADDTFLFAYITDISAMGIFVQTAQPEPPGTLLSLRFTPPAKAGRQGEDEAPEALEFEGEVIWINPPRDEEFGTDAGNDRTHNPGMGIRFFNLSDEQ